MNEWINESINQSIKGRKQASTQEKKEKKRKEKKQKEKKNRCNKDKNKIVSENATSKNDEEKLRKWG